MMWYERSGPGGKVAERTSRPPSPSRSTTIYIETVSTEDGGIWQSSKSEDVAWRVRAVKKKSDMTPIHSPLSRSGETLNDERISHNVEAKATSKSLGASTTKIVVVDLRTESRGSTASCDCTKQKRQHFELSADFVVREDEMWLVKRFTKSLSRPTVHACTLARTTQNTQLDCKNSSPHVRSFEDNLPGPHLDRNAFQGKRLAVYFRGCVFSLYTLEVRPGLHVHL